MGSRSTVDSFPPELRESLNDAIARGGTIDALVELVESAGFEISRSAAGRYSKRYSEIARHQRDVSAVAKALAKDFGGEDDLQGKLMIQLLTSVITRSVMNVAEGEDVGLDGQELHFLARAVKDVTSASKTDQDRMVKVREEAARLARKKAADDAVASGRKAGVSPDVIDRIKRDILGVTA